MNSGNKMQKVIVTGANGFIGSHLCRFLLDRGLHVFGFHYDNDDSLKVLKTNKNFQSYQCDISDQKRVNELFKKIKPQAIFHTAAYLPAGIQSDPAPFFQNNVNGTLNILEACKSHNVKTLVHSSSMSIYGTEIKKLPVNENAVPNPYDFYSLTKKISEDLCAFYAKTQAINIIILRYSGVFGPGKKGGAVTSFFLNALANKPLVIETNINWDIVHVEDITKANFAAYQKAGKLKCKIINIGMGKEINILQLAKKIIKLTRSKSEIQIPKPLSSKPYRFFFDLKEAKKHLGYAPTSIDRGLKKYFDSIKK